MSSGKYKKYRMRKRLFLSRNPEHADHIIAIVEDTQNIFDDEENENWKWSHVDFSIGTDYDRISLNFPMETHEERADSLYKIRRLAKAVCEFRDALEAEARSMNARPSQKDIRRAESEIIEISTVV